MQKQFFKETLTVYKLSEIVFVDDDAIVKMVGVKILKNIGYDGPISQFGNGKEALDEIRERTEAMDIKSIDQPILLLLDINMPVMDSWGFLEEFSQLPEEVREKFFIAIITSSISPQDKDQALSYSDVKDYIQKPISPKYMSDFLKEHGLVED
ncbi:Response regulator receiver domain-containing protein [Algoriphagus faecimaris]|uniref:Response regulator receiver domain-containing protein n=1 Tax=Algoriphagus faecimaris TaxID=686796 RepID=A0A1G6VFW2_9BACT|nr:response regulator [Algoriphagus faecimaris]SDD52381.1 Response regulator receiver domain-containing protein [Algoriphagus faecimaris]